MLKAVSKRLFHSEISFKVLSQSVVTMLDGKLKQHAILQVNLLHNASENCSDVTAPPSLPAVKRQTSMFNDSSSFITPKMICDVFPFHLVFDKELIVKQCGSNIQKLRPRQQYTGGRMTDLFLMIKPHIPFTFDSILRFINATFFLELVNNSSDPGDEGVTSSLVAARMPSGE